MKAGEDIHDFRPNSDDMAKARGADLCSIASGKGLRALPPALGEVAGRYDEGGRGGQRGPLGQTLGQGRGFRLLPAPRIRQHRPALVAQRLRNERRPAATWRKNSARPTRRTRSVYAANAKAWGKELECPRDLGEARDFEDPALEALPGHGARGLRLLLPGFRIQVDPGGGGERGKCLVEVPRRGDRPDPQALGEHVGFPEKNANPRALDSIIKTTGIRKGRALIADGSANGVTTYKAFVQHNVKAIVSGAGRWLLTLAP